MSRKFLLAFAVLPLILLGSSFSRAANAEEDLMKTFDYSTSDNTGFIDGKTLLKELKYPNLSWEQINSNSLISAEMDFVNARYRVKYDLEPAGFVKPFNYGTIPGFTDSSGVQHAPNSYVEGFTFDKFVPKKVVVAGEDYVFNKVNYQMISPLEGVSTEQLETGKVIYDHTVTIDPFCANEIINAAYNVALEQKAIQDKIDAYTNYENYVAKLESYEKYKQDSAAATLKNENIKLYKQAKANYDDVLLPEYDNYIQNILPAYNEKIEKYKAFLIKDAAYTANADKIALAQQKYEKDLELVDFQLGIMDYFYAGKETFPGVEQGGTIYSYIFRDAVSQVVSENNEFYFTSAGISHEMMSNARNATKALQRYLSAYDTIRRSKTEEGIKSRYAYFVNNGKNIKNALLNLTRCLEKFFRNQNVRNEMERRERTQRYIYLLAELIYVSSLFSNNNFECYDAKFSASSSNNYYLNSTFLLDGTPVNQILGVDALVTESLKTATPLSSYPVDAETIYGKKPTIEDFGLTENDLEVVDGVKVVKAPELVEQPIAPTLESFGLDNLEPANAPSISSYGLLDSDFQNGELINIEKPNYDKPSGRDAQFDVFFNSLGKGLSFTNEFDSACDIHVDREYTFNDDRVAKQNIAVMQIVDNAGGASTLKIHEIAFYNDNEEPVLQHEIPPTASETAGKYDYFNSWLKEGQVIELQNIKNESINITADFLYGEDLKTYTVTWVDAETGDELLVNTGYKGFRPFYTSEDNQTLEVTPCKNPTDEFKYVFSGFTYGNVSQPVMRIMDSCDVISPDSDSFEINVHFINEPLYSVTFYDSDENNVAITTAPLANGVFKRLEKNTRIGFDNPSKAETQFKRFEFDHWEELDDSEHKVVNLPVNVTKNIKLVAKYRIYLKYKVNFLDDLNGNKIYNEDKIYEQGDIPNTPTGITKAPNLLANEYYEFDKFVDDNGNGVATLSSSGNNTSPLYYHATFTSHKIIENATISENSSKDTLIVTADQEIDQLSFIKFNKIVGQSFNYDYLDIVFNNIKLEFNNAQARQLYAKNVDTLRVSYTNSNDEISLKLFAKDANDYSNVNGISGTAILSGLTDADHMRAFVNDTRIATVNPNSASIAVNLNSNEEVKIFTFYTISFDVMSNATFKINGEAVSSSDMIVFKKGETIQIEVTPSEGFKINSINLNGDVKSETSIYSFTINADEVVSTSTSKLKFNVSLFVDGEIIETIEVEYGQTLYLEDPSKESDRFYDYTFAGWAELESPDAKSIVVTSDISLHANFTESFISEAVGEELQKDRDILSTILIVVLAAVGAGLLFCLFFLIFVKRNKDDYDNNIAPVETKKTTKSNN